MNSNPEKNNNDSFSLIDFYTENLNDSIKDDYKYDIGQTDITKKIIKVLLQANKPNPLLLAEAGVGKTSVVKGLAKRIKNGTVPKQLLNKQIRELQINNLDVSPSGEKGFFTSNVLNLIQELKERPDIILFIDEIHQIIGSGREDSSNGTDGSQLFKTALADGSISLIGATTFDEYGRFIINDRALQRRFSNINIAEPDPDTTFEILKQNIPYFENNYGQFSISDDNIRLIVKLAGMYFTDTFYPDKAITLFDKSIGTTFYETAYNEKNPEVSEFMIAGTVFEETGIPTSEIMIALHPEISNLESLIEQDVLGQEEAIQQISEEVNRGEVGFKKPHEPLADFLFIGTTGVGKTETAKSLAKHLFGSEENMIELNMGGYKDKRAVERLIGNDFEDGALTKPVRNHPFGVLLLDEIEKANPEVFDLLLSILEEGEIEDAHGRKVNFRNLIIIMTSNLARNYVLKKNSYFNITNESVTQPIDPEDSIELRNKKERYKTTYNKKKKIFDRNINTELSRYFRPELVNRFSNIIVFDVLSMKQTALIAQKYLNNWEKQLKEKTGLDLYYTFDAIQFLIDMGTDYKMGARPLYRQLNHNIIDKFSTDIMFARANPEDSFNEAKKLIIDVSGRRANIKDDFGKNERNNTFEFNLGTSKKPLTEEEKQEKLAIFGEKSIEHMQELSNLQKTPEEIEKEDKSFKSFNARTS